jgi:hypothetical protein
VSEVDRATEILVRARLAERFPQHDIIGEELDERPGRGADFVWAVDPIDGTANFINGFPLFAASIGLLYRGYPLVGAIWCSTSHTLQSGVYHAHCGPRSDATAKTTSFAAWAGTAVAASAMTTVAVSLSTLVSLMVLAAGFEAVFALHVNVERIGRYIQAFHGDGPDRWEQVAMAFGRQFPASGPDPLFARLFILSTSVNFFPAALSGLPLEVIAIGACHFAFIYRVRRAQSAAKAHRAEDLKRFEALRSAPPADPGPAPVLERPID